MATSADKSGIVYPYKEAGARLSRYKHNDKLFEGAHFEAFSIQVANRNFTTNLAKLKYVTANFAGLISKVCADMLFGEPISVQFKDQITQQFYDALVFENKLQTTGYKLALLNSRRGDAVIKVRIINKNGDPRIKLESVNPKIYFPHFADGDDEPTAHELAWRVSIGDNDYLRKEIHTAGMIRNELWPFINQKSDQLTGTPLTDEQTKALLDIEVDQDTGIDRPLIIHIPNWQDEGFFGIDDYRDLNSLMYAVNNRITKNENILDKHSDPILQLPEGVLDENGNIDRAKLGVFEVPNTETGGQSKGEAKYITWNANMDASFKQIDKLVEFLFMFSETSPDALGMGDGKVDSGRALKLRLMRTVAKVSRKRIYFDQGLKEALLVAGKLAYKHKVPVMGQYLNKEPELAHIEWQDGLPIDESELIENETNRIDNGTQSAIDAIMKIDGLSREDATAKYERIKNEGAIITPSAAPSIGG